MRELFVYGTLMSGERAAGMLKGCEFLGEGILNGYALYDLGPFPGIKEKDGTQVIGELYRIPDELIERLDSYEGEGSLYKRETVTINVNNGDYEGVMVYVYLGEIHDEPLLQRWYGN